MQLQKHLNCSYYIKSDYFSRYLFIVYLKKGALALITLIETTQKVEQKSIHCIEMQYNNYLHVALWFKNK